MGSEAFDAEERAVVRVLAAGRLAEVAAMLSKAGRRDLVALVAATDARARGMSVDVPEVEAVLGRVEREEPGDSRLRFWARAVLAERLLLELDGGAFAVASRALDELAGGRPSPHPPLALRYARARLTRVASMTWLFAPTPEGLAAHRRLRDEAVAELLACNLIDEVHVSRGLAAGLTVAVAEEDIVENHARLLDARAALPEDPGSMWPPMLDVFVGIVAFEAGDLDAALQAFDRIDAQPHVHTRVKGLAAYGRALFRIITGGASPHSVAGVERALADVRRSDPRIAQAWHGQLAQTLSDMGSPAAAHFARLEAELPPVGPVHALGRELLAMRIATQGGAPAGVEAALAALEGLESAGYRRRSGRQALRLAHDLSRAGAVESARRLHAWGLDRLPLSRSLTIWERWWSRSVDGDRAWDRVPFAPAGGAARPWRAAPRAQSERPSPDTGAETGRVALRVLAPALELVVDGEPRPVRSTVAKLLIALVVAYPQPLNVEQVADLLWPGAPLGPARHRLNTVVHRARQLSREAGAGTAGDTGTGTGRGDVVRRVGDLVSLDPSGLDVDLLEYRRALDGEPAERATALARVRGNLGQAQFPYDDLLVDVRHRFVAAWLHEARALVTAGHAEAGRLAAAASALGLDPRDLEP
jgi:hypothetical protein